VAWTEGQGYVGCLCGRQVFFWSWQPLLSLQSSSLDIVLAGVVVGSLIASDRIIVVTGIGAHFTSERLNVNPFGVTCLEKPQRCIILEMHKEVCLPENHALNDKHGYNWTLAVVPWEKEIHTTDRTVKQCSSAGILMYSQKSLAVVYWPYIFSEHNYSPIVSLPTDDRPDGIDVLLNERIASSRKSGTPWVGSSSSSEFTIVNPMIASPNFRFYFI
jgi:hypothetical protein